MQVESGALYIVATPIGHKDDITYRAVNVLKHVDAILAEDTRHSRSLLTHYAITTPLHALHDHNESDKAQRIIAQLKEGRSLALISDAGTPVISDPGYLLVKCAYEAGCRVIPIPGACAAIAALCACGLPPQPFSFEGFLPSRASARQKQLTSLQQDTRTLIFYEAPHRLAASLSDMQHCLGANRQAALARELTKKFETIHRTSLEELAHWVNTHPHQQKGECVIIVQGASDSDITYQAKQQATRLLTQLMQKLPLREAVDLTVAITGYPKNALYKLALDQ